MTQKVLCDQTQCLYNQNCVCKAAQPYYKGGKCVTFKLRAKPSDVIIKIFYDLRRGSKPFLLIAEELGIDLTQYGFEREIHPLGLQPPVVWAKAVASYKEEMELLKPFGFIFSIQIDKHLLAAWDTKEKLVNMSDREKKDFKESVKRPVEPNKPSCIGVTLYWNGKIYGLENNRHIYLAGERKNITKAEEEELTAYKEQMDDYRQKQQEYDNAIFSLDYYLADNA